MKAPIDTFFLEGRARVSNLYHGSCSCRVEAPCLLVFRLDNVDLGTACGKYYRVSCLSILDPGDSDIIKSLPGDQ
ncbi:Putative 60S ribosomal protein L30-1 [Morus notabilis]|uniref:Putative 60S ribosomal protein L30-1 n=1 Tax=Morus notabilis TaxID=981085 RepID=W9S0K7_9ROSA|nr:Putative 60S ribosomal protein L30-1 [Morus notabilis]